MKPSKQANFPGDAASHSGPSTKVTLLSRLGERRDEDAWQQFVELYAPLIRRYCRRAGLQDADSEDVAQAVFSNLSQFMDRFEYDSARGRFRSWMGVVVTREIQRHLRKNARPGGGPGEGAHESLLDEMPNNLDPSWCDDFNACMLQLAWSRVKSSFDEATQQAFQSTWMDAVDPRQVAADLEQSVAWVYKARYRVLQRLKAELKMLCMDEPLLNR